MEQVSLKQHFDQRFVDNQKALDIALTATQRATDLALDNQKRVNETQNEFRQALKDQAAHFPTRAEMEARFDGLDKNRKDKTALLIAVVGVVISILGLIGKFWDS